MTRKATSEYTTSVRSISITHITAPSSEMYQRVRKVGRYEGFPAKYSRKDTVQSAP